MKYSGVWILAQRGDATPSEGHAIDHIGWRTPNLDAKTKELKAQNVKFTTEPRPLRLAATVIVLGLLAAFGASSCNSNDPESNSVSSSTSSRPAPAPNRVNAGLISLPRLVLDAENRATSGGPIKLANYSGKVLLVNLWATWCGPCRMETPELVKLHREFQSRGVEMIALSTEDPEASAQSVSNFVREFHVDYQVGWATREVAQTLMQGRTSIPQSFIIARDGRIVRRFIGFNPDTTPPQIKQALEEAVEWGIAAASLSVERRGCQPAMPRRDEIEVRMRGAASP